ncbi:QDE2 protein [Hyaloscypha sp. PMI_1271]|nr:QDE2 protein [Hyaloscypha sp. PMI_1271]
MSYRGTPRGGGGGGGGGGGPAVIRVFRDPNSSVPAPARDLQLKDIEDNYMEATKGLGGMANLSVTAQVPPRPGHGMLGKQILVYANYFKLIVPNDLSLARYGVEVVPEVKGHKLGRVFQLLLELPVFAGVASDLRSMIVSPRELNIAPNFSVQIGYLAEGQEEHLPRAVTYTVKLITRLTFSVSNLVDYLSSVNPTPDFVQKAEIIQILNVLFGHYPQSQSGVVSIGQNRHFSVDHSQENSHNIRNLSGGLEALRGYFQSVRSATGGLLLNVNVTHGVFFEPISLALLFPKLGTGNKVTLQKNLKLVRVRVTHLPGRTSKKTNQTFPRVKTIFGLADPQDGGTEAHSPRVTSFGAGPKDVKFWLSDVPPAAAGANPPGKGKAGQKGGGPPMRSNTYISVFDYFRSKYPQISLNDRAPVVNVGNRENPNYLPAEVCQVLPGETLKCRLSPGQAQAMITFACRKPFENANSIIGDGKAILGLNHTANSIAKTFGLTVGPSLITVAARVLTAPLIKYRNSQNEEHNVNPSDGSWNMVNVKFHTGSDLGPWTYIYFRSNRRGDQFQPADLQKTVTRFRDFLTKSGVDAGGFFTPPPQPVDLVDGRAGTNDQNIEKGFLRLSEAKENPCPRFVLCVLPFNDVAIYNSIKTVADTKAGIHTVCVVRQKFMKNQQQEQYFGNISLKFNLKAGGINQSLELPKMGIIGEVRTMVLGIDVTHPSPGSKDGTPSVAAVVASIDKYLAQWPCRFGIQDSRKEMVTALEGMVLSLLELWQKRNEKLPVNILIYRDGVSEGQFQQVLDIELPLIRNACRQVYPAIATKQGFPKISIIICGKRHHTRFYPADTKNADKFSNCPPSTVVDRGVTEVRVWDFYLQPHACRQGTARPCHYTVIFDEIFHGRAVKQPHTSPADALEELTHNMCHLFGRATKAVSLCPPAYYADLLCTRLRCYLADQFDPSNNPAAPSVASGATSQTPFNIQIHADLEDSMFYI